MSSNNVINCDYCGNPSSDLRGAPSLRDAELQICKECWNTMKREEWNGSGLWIGEWGQESCVHTNQSDPETGEPLTDYYYDETATVETLVKVPKSTK